MIETVMRVFLDACGLSSALILECDDPGLPAGASIWHEHGLPFVIVGRDARSDFQLNDPLISRRHAYLQVLAGRLFCFDLDSRSQIRWEGADQPATKGWLEQEHFVWLGRYRVRWRGLLGSNAQDANTLDPLTSSLVDEALANPLPEAQLELPIRIGESLSSWSISPQLSVIGKSSQCQLVLTDNSISTYHASLVRTPLGIWVVDLLSREGIWVNGTRVRWAWLDDGDTLRIGRFSFVLRYRTLPERISRQDVPVDAGAIFATTPVAAAGKSAALPVKVEKPLALRSSRASRSPNPLAPYSSVAAPLSVGPRGGDEWNLTPGYGVGPGAMWSQHIQFLEMLHSEMILMVRMFMTMHREHVDSIREELDRVQQLTRELETLQAKLGESPKSERVPPKSGADRERRETKPRLSAKTNREHRSRDSSSAGRTESRENRKPPDLAVNSEVESAPPRHAIDSERRDEAHAMPLDTAEFHAQITKRITELQRERQGYWRRILNVISVSAD
jgi:pSer/pThr/pTyr-binding forkhead associated (FHA) protein